MGCGRKRDGEDGKTTGCRAKETMMHRGLHENHPFQHVLGVGNPTTTWRG